MQDLKTILLGEDHPNDVEPTLEALADYRLANDIVVVNDGEATLDTSIGAAGSRGASPRPRRSRSSTSRYPRWTDSRCCAPSRPTRP